MVSVTRECLEKGAARCLHRVPLLFIHFLRRPAKVASREHSRTDFVGEHRGAQGSKNINENGASNIHDLREAATRGVLSVEAECSSFHGLQGRWKKAGMEACEPVRCCKTMDAAG